MTENGYIWVPILTPDGCRKMAQGRAIGPDRLDLRVNAGEKPSYHFLDCYLGGENVRADWIKPEYFDTLLTALMPENRLALQISEATGLRIGDVLKLRPDDLKTQRPTLKEQKTGKARRIYIPKKLWEEAQRQAGPFFVFEGRTDSRKHRTRQAVYKDLRRVAELYRIDGKKIQEHISPHSARKVYAVELAKDGGLPRVRRDMRHSSDAVAMLYAMADILTEQAKKSRQKT